MDQKCIIQVIIRVIKLVCIYWCPVNCFTDMSIIMVVSGRKCFLGSGGIFSCNTASGL